MGREQEALEALMSVPASVGSNFSNGENFEFKQKVDLRCKNGSFFNH